jgi:hypothetical protein
LKEIANNTLLKNLSMHEFCDIKISETKSVEQARILKEVLYEWTQIQYIYNKESSEKVQTFMTKFSKKISYLNTHDPLTLLQILVGGSSSTCTGIYADL